MKYLKNILCFAGSWQLVFFCTVAVSADSTPRKLPREFIEEFERSLSSRPHVLRGMISLDGNGYTGMAGAFYDVPQNLTFFRKDSDTILISNFGDGVKPAFVCTREGESALTSDPKADKPDRTEYYEELFRILKSNECFAVHTVIDRHWRIDRTGDGFQVTDVQEGEFLFKFFENGKWVEVAVAAPVSEIEVEPLSQVLAPNSGQSDLIQMIADAHYSGRKIEGIQVDEVQSALRSVSVDQDIRLVLERYFSFIQADQADIEPWTTSVIPSGLRESLQIGFGVSSSERAAMVKRADSFSRAVFSVLFQIATSKEKNRVSDFKDLSSALDQKDPAGSFHGLKGVYSAVDPTSGEESALQILGDGLMTFYPQKEPWLRESGLMGQLVSTEEFGQYRLKSDEIPEGMDIMVSAQANGSLSMDIMGKKADLIPIPDFEASRVRLAKSIEGTWSIGFVTTYNVDDRVTELSMHRPWSTVYAEESHYPVKISFDGERIATIEDGWGRTFKTIYYINPMKNQLILYNSDPRQIPSGETGELTTATISNKYTVDLDVDGGKLRLIAERITHSALEVEPVGYDWFFVKTAD